jgi:hypothetical protein
MAVPGLDPGIAAAIHILLCHEARRGSFFATKQGVDRRDQPYSVRWLNMIGIGSI